MDLSQLPSINLSANYSINNSITENIPENKPKCCIFGKCEDCCQGDECSENYPLLFVHGHAISKQNRPEQSHESFGKIQELFEKEGFVNGGQIALESNIA